IFFFSSRRRHTIFSRDWSSDVCSSDLTPAAIPPIILAPPLPPGALSAPTAGCSEEDATAYLLLLLLLYILFVAVMAGLNPEPPRSEERRVGKECRSRR